MRQLEWSGMLPPEPMSPQEIRSIREREDLDLYVFANMLNTTARVLRRWEQGLNRPTGPVLRFLHAIRARGMEGVFP
ncbi:helix-turn-helix domain-containing protein [Roseateles sp. L2-2]